jgi:hypothetical protein
MKNVSGHFPKTDAQRLKNKIQRQFSFQEMSVKSA